MGGVGDTIRIRIADVERVRSAVDQAEKAIRQALASVDQALQSADWQDGNRRAFEDRWRSARAATEFDTRARDLRNELNRVITKAKALGGH